MRCCTYIGAWLAVWTILSSCGPVSDAKGYASELLHPGLTVAWHISEDRTQLWCANRDDAREVTVWGSAAFCFWDCGYYQGNLQRVIVDADIGPDGLFIPADEMRVVTGQCFDEDVTL